MSLVTHSTTAEGRAGGVLSTGSDDDRIDRRVEAASPRRILRNLFAYRELLRNLVLKDLKLKYRGSVFGFLWSLANPLLMIVVYTVAFTLILRVGREGFVVHLMLGMLSWSFFASSAAMSTGAIVDNSGLLKSVRFPRAILPIATVLFNLAQYVLTLAVFLPAMVWWHDVPLSSSIVLFPVFIALQCTFTIGIALLLAAITAFFRDVRHLLEVALAVLFWTTPIVYEIGQVPEWLRPWVLLSPMSSFVVAYQTLFTGAWPGAAAWAITLGYALAAFGGGWAVFHAVEPRLAEQL